MTMKFGLRSSYRPPPPEPLGSFSLGNGRSLIVVKGSVLDCRVEAMVNAANEGGLFGGGVDGAFNMKGGRALAKARERLPVLRTTRGGSEIRIETGTAAVTSSNKPFGELTARHVIHAVGPNYWDVSGRQEISATNDKLQTAYQHSLKIAAELGVSDLAFSLLSAGVFKGSQPLQNVLGYGVLAVKSWFEVNEELLESLDAKKAQGVLEGYASTDNGDVEDSATEKGAEEANGTANESTHKDDEDGEEGEMRKVMSSNPSNEGSVLEVSGVKAGIENAEEGKTVEKIEPKANESTVAAEVAESDVAQGSEETTQESAKGIDEDKDKPNDTMEESQPEVAEEDEGEESDSSTVEELQQEQLEGDMSTANKPVLSNVYLCAFTTEECKTLMRVCDAIFENSSE